MWKTTDGGMNWTEELLPFGWWIFDAYFADLNNIWAVGSGGNILKYTNSLNIPNSPSNLTANTISSNEIMINWTDNSNNEDGFYIFRSDSISGDFQLIKSVGTNVTNYNDTGLSNEVTYWYRACAYNSVGLSAKSLDAFATTSSSFVESKPQIPINFALEQNYPNPFNPTTLIQYSIPERENNSFVKLEIYNLQGKLIKTLIGTNLASGNYQIKWDAIDNSGRHVPSGLYLYRLRVNSFVQSKKMLLLK